MGLSWSLCCPPSVPAAWRHPGLHPCLQRRLHRGAGAGRAPWGLAQAGRQPGLRGPAGRASLGLPSGQQLPSAFPASPSYRDTMPEPGSSACPHPAFPTGSPALSPSPVPTRAQRACLQVPVLRVLLAADLKEFHHFSSVEEAGGCWGGGPEGSRPEGSPGGRQRWGRGLPLHWRSVGECPRTRILTPVSTVKTTQLGHSHHSRKFPPPLGGPLF